VESKRFLTIRCVKNRLKYSSDGKKSNFFKEGAREEFYGRDKMM